MSKSAKASARIFEQGRVSAEQLLSAVDPLFAAQLRYDKELARAEQLMKAGTLTAAEFAKVQTGLKTQLDAASGSFAAFTKVQAIVVLPCSKCSTSPAALLTSSQPALQSPKSSLSTWAKSLRRVRSPKAAWASSAHFSAARGALP
jgi:hypothetical protein